MHDSTKVCEMFLSPRRNETYLQFMHALTLYLRTECFLALYLLRVACNVRNTSLYEQLQSHLTSIVLAVVTLTTSARSLLRPSAAAPDRPPDACQG